MAVAFGDEGETDGVVTRVALAAGSPLPVTEWGDAELFKEVNGYLITLRRAVGVELMKVEATHSPLRDFKFMKLFDDEQLRIAGFSGRMPFEDCIKVICDALNGEETMTATLTADGSGDFLFLHITVSMAYVVAEYKLALERVSVVLSDRLSVDLRSVKQQLAAAIIELQSTKATLRDAVSGSDAVIEELREANAKAMAECRTFEQQLADLRAEIRIRDLRISELEKSLAAVATTAAVTRTPAFVEEVGDHFLEDESDPYDGSKVKPLTIRSLFGSSSDEDDIFFPRASKTPKKKESPKKKKKAAKQKPMAMAAAIGGAKAPAKKNSGGILNLFLDSSSSALLGSYESSDDDFMTCMLAFGHFVAQK